MTTETGGMAAASNGSAVRAIGITTVATAVGYAITLIQQMLYARALGVSADTDALGAALAWAVGTTGPVGITLATVFLPRYVRASHDAGDTGAIRSRATVIALATGAFLLVLTLVGAPLLAAVLVPGGDDARRETLAGILRIAAPLEVTWPLVWQAVSSANARERYLLAAGSFILPPLPVIGLLLAGVSSVQLVAFGYVAGTILQLVAVWALEPQARPMVDLSASRAVIEIRRDVLPVGAVFALLSIIPLEVRGLASVHGNGAIAIADYASRLVVAGQQVLLSGLLAVTFTRWSKQTDAEERGGIDSVERTLLLVGAVGAIIAMLLPFVSVVVIRIILSGGRFEQADADAVGAFVAWMGPGIAGQMVLMVSLRALFAADQGAPPLLAAGAAVLAALVVGVAAQAVWGLNGVAAGYSAAYLVAAAVAVWGIRTRLTGDRSLRPASLPIPPRETSLLTLREEVQ